MFNNFINLYFKIYLENSWFATNTLIDLWPPLVRINKVEWRGFWLKFVLFLFRYMHIAHCTKAIDHANIKSFGIDVLLRASCVSLWNSSIGMKSLYAFLHFIKSPRRQFTSKHLQLHYSFYSETKNPNIIYIFIAQRKRS